ncbi:hypothetical protein TM7_0012 [candidate division TM7 genomosp. GTL1]|nr:hypothetical protein TM7_0012 [candidate division TM7 genomosp. GTL1]
MRNERRHAERKTWKQITKGEKAVGFVVLGAAVVVGFSIVSGIVNAISSSSQLQKIEKVKKREPIASYKEVKETETIPFEKITKNDISRKVGIRVISTSGIDGVDV